jgi:hypothetical protein
VDAPALLLGYRAATGEALTFLGRPARRLHVLPRHEGRPRFELVLDGETGLPLQVTTIGHRGDVYRVTSFRDVSIGARAVEGPARPRACEGEPGAEAELPRLVPFRMLVPAYLPPGFRCIGAAVVGQGPATAVLVYSDGGTLAELRQRPAEAGGGPEGEVTRRQRWRHFVYELRAKGLDVRLTSRADFDQEESLRILRSLKAQ